MHKREPISLELCKVTHVRKGGGYINSTCTQEFMGAAKAKVYECSAGSEKPPVVIHNEVFIELMYSDDKPNQRVVGYRVGISRRQVFVLKGQLKRLHNDDLGSSSIEVLGIKAHFVSVEEKSDKIISQLQQRKKELEKRTEALREMIRVH